MPFDVHFLRPLWFFALLPLVLLLVALWRQRMGGASVWRGLVDPHLLAHLLVGEEGRPKRWPLILLGLGWSLLILALAGPVWERLPQPVFSTTGQRVILLDLSPSMNAADLPPSRLTRARFEILDLLRASKEGQVALMAFGPEPFVVSPLTGDARTIEAQVPQLTTDLVPVPGPRRTDLALQMAGEMLDRAQGSGGDLILVTDAVGDMAGSLEAARRLQAAGHRLSVLAVGTPKGAPVPASNGGFLKDAKGGIQVARLDQEQLRELAKAGKGLYLEAEAGDRDTQALIAAAPRLGERIEQTALTADQWREEGPWLLLILLPLAALAFRRGWLLPVVILAMVLPPRPGFAFGWQDLWARPDQRAARQFESGETQAAAEQFQDPSWRAAARYRSGDFQAALDSVSGLKGSDADYNRGNALARLGRFQEAVNAYENVLKQDPDQADARHNLELVQKLLEQQNQEKRAAGKAGRIPSSKNSRVTSQAIQTINRNRQGRSHRAGKIPSRPRRPSRPRAGGQGQSQNQNQAGADDSNAAQEDQSSAQEAAGQKGEQGKQGEKAGASANANAKPSDGQPASPSDGPNDDSATASGRDAAVDQPSGCQ